MRTPLRATVPRPGRARLLPALLALAAGTLVATPPDTVLPVTTAVVEDVPAAIAADTYTWKNVRIDGGGFVPGIVFNRTEKNLAYARTDIGGVRGIFRSTDRGENWTRINDDAHQWSWTGAAITGDPRVCGRVYVSTNGRGVLYGDP